MPTFYMARIFDRQGDRHLFSSVGIISPRRLGQVTGGALATLAGRDGLDPAMLEVRTSAEETGGRRALDAAESHAVELGLRDVSVPADGSARDRTLPS